MERISRKKYNAMMRDAHPLERISEFIGSRYEVIEETLFEKVQYGVKQAAMWTFAAAMLTSPITVPAAIYMHAKALEKSTTVECAQYDEGSVIVDLAKGNGFRENYIDIGGNGRLDHYSNSDGLVFTFSENPGSTANDLSRDQGPGKTYQTQFDSISARCQE